MEPNEYARRMKRCSIEELDLKILLDEYTYSIIYDLQTSTNLPSSYIFLAVVIGIAHWSNGSTIKGINFYSIPLILFGILCGASGD